jgi:hypothetical protein
VESRLLGFPYSVISMACFGNAFHKITITTKARFENRNHLSEMPTTRPCAHFLLADHSPTTPLTPPARRSLAPKWSRDVNLLKTRFQGTTTATSDCKGKIIPALSEEQGQFWSGSSQNTGSAPIHGRVGALGIGSLRKAF